MGELRDDLNLLRCVKGGRGSDFPFASTRCHVYIIGAVPERELHCKVISFPSDASPSFQHLGFEGFSGKEEKKHQWDSPCESEKKHKNPEYSTEKLSICFENVVTILPRTFRVMCVHSYCPAFLTLHVYCPESLGCRREISKEASPVRKLEANETRPFCSSIIS